MIRVAAILFAAFALMAAAPMTSPPSKAKPPLPIPSAGALLESFAPSGLTAFMVLDLDTGETLEAVAPDLPLPPASVAKSVTAVYALDRLGAGRRFETRIAAVGPIENGILNGDLILQGGGDPELDSVGLDDLAAELALAGVRRVEGRFLVDESLSLSLERIDDTQPEMASYNPSISALSLNFNRVHAEWRRGSDGYAFKVEARADGLSPPTSIIRVDPVAETSNGQVFDHRLTEDRELWGVRRKALGKRGARWLPVRRPALFAGSVFRDLAQARGVIMPAPEVGRAPVVSNVIVRRDSRALAEMAKDMMKFSTNLTAEALGLAATGSAGAAPTSLAASAGAMNAWMAGFVGIQPGDPGVALLNHSGLSGDSRATARRLTELLSVASNRGFPALNGGRAATLFALMKEVKVLDKDVPPPRIPYMVRAKTGTLNFASALSGYIVTDHRRLAFTIMSADIDRRDALVNPAVERPRGARSWSSRARALQRGLVRSWIDRFGVPRAP